MSTYIDGKLVRYPKVRDWARRWLTDGDWERGMVTSVGEDGTVSVYWDQGEEEVFQPDVLILHPSGWYWYEPEEEVKSWG